LVVHPSENICDHDWTNPSHPTKWGYNSLAIQGGFPHQATSLSKVLGHAEDIFVDGGGIVDSAGLSPCLCQEEADGW
jgi:hypothetical protein